MIKNILFILSFISFGLFVLNKLDGIEKKVKALNSKDVDVKMDELLNNVELSQRTAEPLDFDPKDYVYHEDVIDDEVYKMMKDLFSFGRD